MIGHHVKAASLLAIRYHHVRSFRQSDSTEGDDSQIGRLLSVEHLIANRKLDWKNLNFEFHLRLPATRHLAPTTGGLRLPDLYPLCT